jgi:hypothetical protein
MFLLLKQRDFELLRRLDGRVVQGDIVHEDFRNGGLLEDRLPWAFGLARAAIDALVRVYVELVGKLLSVVAYVLVDAVNRTDTDASCVEIIYAKTGYGPRHLLVFYLLNGPQPNERLNPRFPL